MKLQTLYSSIVIALIYSVRLSGEPIHPEGFYCSFLDEMHFKSERFRPLNSKTIDDQLYEKPWGLDNNFAYETDNFSPGFKKSKYKCIKEYLRQSAVKKGRKLNVVEYFGSAIITPHLENIRSLTGVRLLPLHSSDFPTGFSHENHEQISGNIYENKTWEKVKLRLEDLSIEGFDTAFIRPIGGSPKGDYSFHLLLLVVNLVYQKQKSGGDILIESSAFRDEKFLEPFKADLEKAGIYFESIGDYFLIKRGTQKVLPLNLVTRECTKKRR